ncbi:MAG: hypothetical protein ACRDRL_28775, partial [Sciscionella sp.]
VLATTVAAIGFGAVVQTWLLRGQSEQQLADLTGRQKVWDGLLAAPRTLHDQLIGMGLSNKSFGGLPVDSSWLSVYQDQGLIGVAIIAAMFVVLLVTAAIRPPSPARAAAIFLIVFCAISSYTEDGLGDATTYFLHLTLAAALLAPGAAAAFSAPPSASREQRASTRDDRSHPG